MRTRILTGVTPSGIPHLGNYVGAIRPAITASQSKQNDSFFFLSDYHALIKCKNAALIEQSTKAVAFLFGGFMLTPIGMERQHLCFPGMLPKASLLHPEVPLSRDSVEPVATLSSHTM